MPHTSVEPQLSWTPTVTATIGVAHTPDIPSPIPRPLALASAANVTADRGSMKAGISSPQLEKRRRLPADKKELSEEMELMAAEKAVKLLQEFLRLQEENTMHRSACGRNVNAAAVDLEVLNLAKGTHLHQATTMRAFVNKLHHANLTLQRQTPLFTKMTHYSNVSMKLSPLFARFKDNPEDTALQGLVTEGRNECLTKLEQDIIHYCVLHYDVHGAVGETPVHLAFLCQQHELAKKMISSTARFHVFSKTLGSSAIKIEHATLEHKCAERACPACSGMHTQRAL
jgi:hypothetical protein